VGDGTATPDLGRLYLDGHARLAALAAGLDRAALATPVPACPGWSVHDVLAHLAAIPGDVLTGRLTGPPDEAWTAAQVARFAGHDAGRMLATWAQAVPRFAELVGGSGVWPAVLDLTSHEQDIRSAVGRPGARDSEAVRVCADALLGWLDPPVPLRVVVEDGEYLVGPDQGGTLGLATTRFEALRWRMGRRSRAQLAALDWSGDPAPVLDHLVVFGPAGRDVIE
jgi:uncharacterized protein (TIGR03083 family)